VARENYTTRRFTICNHLQIIFGEEIKTSEMSGACGTHGGEAICK